MTKPKPKDQHKKSGPKDWAPSDEQRAEIRGMAIANLPIEFIAEVIGKDPKTIQKACPEEVKKGRARLIAAAATQTARFVYGAKAEFDDAGNMIRAEVKPEQAACFFVLKTQAKKHGWSERVEHTGADGAPLFNDLDLTKLTDPELKALTKLLRKAGVEI